MENLEQLNKKTFLKNWSKEAMLKFYEDILPDISDNSGNDEDSKPKKLTKSLRYTNEKAYQRAFFLESKNNKPTELKRSSEKEQNIKWLDMEIPIVFKKGMPRRKCLDLIGKIDDEFIIAELKGKGGTSPFCALYEAIHYAKSADENYSKLKNHPPGDNYWLDYRKCKYLIIAAPKEYWNKWKTVLFNKIESPLTLCGYEIIFAEFKDEDFKKQQGGKGKTYKPRLERCENKWNELCN